MVVMVTSFWSSAQEWNCVPGGNTIATTEYLGADALSTTDLRIKHRGDYKLFLGTSDILRFRMNRSLANGTFNSFTGQNFGGFVAMSKDGSGIATPGAFTQLHLYSRNDPAWIPLRNKLSLMLAGSPDFFPNFAAAEQATHRPVIRS